MHLLEEGLGGAPLSLKGGGWEFNINLSSFLNVTSLFDTIEP